MPLISANNMRAISSSDGGRTGGVAFTMVGAATLFVSFFPSILSFFFGADGFEASFASFLIFDAAISFFFLVTGVRFFFTIFDASNTGGMFFVKGVSFAPGLGKHGIFDLGFIVKLFDGAFLFLFFVETPSRSSFNRFSSRISASLALFDNFFPPSASPNKIRALVLPITPIGVLDSIPVVASFNFSSISRIAIPFSFQSVSFTSHAKISPHSFTFLPTLSIIGSYSGIFKPKCLHIFTKTSSAFACNLSVALASCDVHCKFTTTQCFFAILGSVLAGGTRKDDPTTILIFASFDHSLAFSNVSSSKLSPNCTIVSFKCPSHPSVSHILPVRC
mmetsp:Transcript_2212/g.6792  ORF Transcript_2212/g.6792 Transcript_2212/m.6792 type:complete len:333 (-) Transcript_2212:802-1800(-)